MVRAREVKVRRTRWAMLVWVAVREEWVVERRRVSISGNSVSCLVVADWEP